MAKNSAGTSSLHRHLRVLGAFDAVRPFRTLSELARDTGMPASTLHRLLGDLENEGLIERMPDRAYRLGLRLWELAAQAPGAVGLREVARPWLAAVQSRVRQHTQLGVVSGTDVLFIDRLSDPDGVVNVTLIGGRLPMHASSTGLVLLAHAPLDTVDAVTAAGLRPYTDRTIRTRAQLDEALAHVRADGFIVNDGHIHAESRGVAVPVRGPDGSVSAALGAVVPNDGVSSLPTIETLAIAARGIERALADAYAGRTSGAAVSAQPGISGRSWEHIARLHRVERAARG
jgi:DNA-binding IclR family transcriptional regulator